MLRKGRFSETYNSTCGFAKMPMETYNLSKYPRQYKIIAKMHISLHILCF